MANKPVAVIYNGKAREILSTDTPVDGSGTPFGSFATRVRAYDYNSGSGLLGTSETFDNNGDWNTTTRIFTAPATGVYVIYAQGEVTNVSGTRVRLDIVQGASTVIASGVQSQTGSSVANTVTVQTIASLSATNTIKVQRTVEAGASDLETASTKTFLTIFRIA